jgi:hypothetical protein
VAESHIGQWWDESAGEVGKPPDTPPHEVLRWVIHQINRGNFVREPEYNGRMDTLIVGRAAAPECTGKQWVEEQQGRNYALVVAGLFARGRESGVEPQHGDLSERVRFESNENVAFNTELHYALELMDVLKNVRSRTFQLVTLPLVGKASPEVVDLIREATRCHLFGLHRGCVAVCRAVLEKALSERLPSDDVAKEREQYPKKGDLELMITLAGKLELLDKPLVDFGHNVRTKGNAVLHAKNENEVDDSFIVLSDTRLILERLFARATP